MSDKRLKAINVKGSRSVLRTYRVVPYPEIENILKNNGEAFVEGIDRRTAFYAKKVLSKKLKQNIKAESRLIFTEENKDIPMKGYMFTIDEKA
jgi:hypothetical protein